MEKPNGVIYLLVFCTTYHHNTPQTPPPRAKTDRLLFSWTKWRCTHHLNVFKSFCQKKPWLSIHKHFQNNFLRTIVHQWKIAAFVQPKPSNTTPSFPIRDKHPPESKTQALWCRFNSNIPDGSANLQFPYISWAKDAKSDKHPKRHSTSDRGAEQFIFTLFILLRLLNPSLSICHCISKQ